MKNYRSILDQELSELQLLLSQMGKQVETACQMGLQALMQRDSVMAQQVIDGDKAINQLEEDVMNLGAQIIATQQPVAKDMRKILTAFKISSDLERMGDLALDVAKVALRLGKDSFIKPLIDIPRMGEIIQTMIVESMESYCNEDVNLAYKMAKMDDEVDQLYSQVLRELLIFMIENPTTINQAMNLCFVGRYLERIADHATNIGESTVYLVESRRTDLN